MAADRCRGTVLRAGWRTIYARLAELPIKSDIGSKRQLNSNPGFLRSKPRTSILIAMGRTATLE
jgi:hypothetical protein